MTGAAGRPVVALAALTALLAGCSAGITQDERNSLDFGSDLAFRLPVHGLLGRRFETVVRQQYDFSCGSAALATLLRFHYGDPQTEETVFLGMWRDGDQAQIRRLGFSLLDMKRYLAARGLAADGYRVTPAQISKAQVPGIALINYDGYLHFVVVKGIEGQSILLGDPSLGLRRESLARFTKQWNGVLFVLNANPSVGRNHFNQAADRALAPHGRFDGEADPLSLAALALTAPVVIAPVLNEF